MEDRYEIRGKIGQGGIGTVYRGYDMRMNREVAIKRILQSPEDPTLREEATKQLVVEAGALASLQHPNIVTVYDVGSDDDGPYVVMELISGKTLDEIIEAAPLTWQDFREVAMQSQEALIAAQELDMIHSDLKPPNIMLTWLPSGKFQVKIVDFGLAVLTQNQSKEEIESLEAVFGSIFFMPPEQFERETLCARSDLYSIGCVYYQALTGVYPFSGETGTEVMEAHLNHTVTPIQELRADIPVWACDWVMWHINRYRDDRPESAREALSVFLQNDKDPNPAMSRGSAVAKRPRLIIPGQVPSGPSTPDAPGIIGVPLMPPDTMTGRHMTAEEGRHSKTAPQPLAPPDGSKPSVHTSAAPLHEAQPRMKTQAAATLPASKTAEVATATSRQVYISPVTSTAQAGKPKIPNSIKIVMAVVLVILIVVVSMMLIDRSKQNERNKIYSELVAKAADDNTREVPMTGEQLDILIEVVTSTAAVNERELIYKALAKARMLDGTDLDKRLVELVSSQEMMAKVRKQLISDAIAPRQNPAVIIALMKFAESTTDIDSALAAYDAVRPLLTDDHVDPFLDVLMTIQHAALKRAAEANLDHIIGSSSNRESISRRIISRYDGVRDDKVRHALIRLLGRTNTDDALELIRETLNTGKTEDQIAAIVALGSWEGEKAFDVLKEFLDGAQDRQLRDKAIESMIRLSTQQALNEGGDAMSAKGLWSNLAGSCKIGPEKEKVIRSVVSIEAPWVVELLQPFTSDSSSSVATLAKRGIEIVRDREQLKSK